MLGEQQRRQHPAAQTAVAAASQTAGAFSAAAPTHPLSASSSAILTGLGRGRAASVEPLLEGRCGSGSTSPMCVGPAGMLGL